MKFGFLALRTNDGVEILAQAVKLHLVDDHGIVQHYFFNSVVFINIICINLPKNVSFGNKKFGYHAFLGLQV